MKRLIIAAAFILLLVTMVSAQDAKNPRTPCAWACREAIGESVTGLTVDKLSTDKCIRAGCVESNPLLQNSKGGLSNAKYLGIAGGITGGLIALRLTTHDPRNARIYDWSLRVVGYVHIGVAIHNYQLARELSNGRVPR